LYAWWCCRKGATGNPHVRKYTVCLCAGA